MNKILAIIAIAGTMMTTSISTKADNQWLGPVIGGIAGGFLGNKIGGGTGKMVATAAGAVGGFLLGQEAVRQPAHSPTPVNTQIFLYFLIKLIKRHILGEKKRGPNILFDIKIVIKILKVNGAIIGGKKCQNPK